MNRLLRLKFFTNADELLFGCLLTSNKRRRPQDGARPRVTLLVDDQSAQNHRSQMRNNQELWLQRTSCDSSGCYSVPPYHFRSDRLSSWWLHFPCFGLKSSAAWTRWRVAAAVVVASCSSSSLFRPNEKQKCQVAFVLRVVGTRWIWSSVRGTRLLG
jgi:hypothetical protein